jgi:hypothetical protein
MTLNPSFQLLQFFRWSTDLPFEDVVERAQVIVACNPLELSVLILNFQNRFCQSKVAYLQLVVLFFVDKDVFWLYVAMNLAVLVNVA